MKKENKLENWEEAKKEINRILVDYGLVEGEPLDIDVVDKILEVFRSLLLNEVLKELEQIITSAKEKGTIPDDDYVGEAEVLWRLENKIKEIKEKDKKTIKLSKLEGKILNWLDELPQLAMKEKQIATEYPEIYKEILRPTIDFLMESREIVENKIERKKQENGKKG